ncbi:hypothetical protein DAEQUDRAFT_810018 [Daedalea quercina L-15889]|uniref:Uncharacterized protein n=1 Tax=Daedalea quercina L-15889 TaxID=1314783 RepID=A0A165RZC2_9APHY|nr:hypothetical protein DAEQUDRAFT_810018 [Daedalea quercina L-15889]
MSAVELVVNDDHPLALELASLRSAVDRYQHEAHAASVKLQRHSLDTTHAIERAYALESENAKLREEVATLKAHPDTAPHPAELQVQELTIAHRRLSDKLTLTEEALFSRTSELISTQSDFAKIQNSVDAAHELAAQRQGQVKVAEAKQRELERKLRAAEEERKLSDLVVQEYADLVRTLEGRPRTQAASASAASFPLGNAGNNSSATLVDSLSEGKSGLQKLLGELNGEHEQLGAEVSRLQGELTGLESELQVERKRGLDDRAQLAQSLVDMERYRIDDNTAAKMVSRYMKFSQSATDSLQKCMEGMKARYAASTATLSAQINYLQKALETERRQSEKLRQALDELTEDISREAYGRRREISLRLAFLGREESLAESLRRWIRRSRESFDRMKSAQENLPSAVQAVFDGGVRNAEALLETLNGQPSVDPGSTGYVARVVEAQSVAAGLARELQIETDRRMQLERRLAQRRISRPATPNGVQEWAPEPAANGDADAGLVRPLPVRGASLLASMIVGSKDVVSETSQQEAANETQPTTPTPAPQIVVLGEGEVPPQATDTGSTTVDPPPESVAAARISSQSVDESAQTTTPTETPLEPPPAPAITTFSVAPMDGVVSETVPVTASVVEARSEILPDSAVDILFQPLSAPPVAVTSTTKIEGGLGTAKPAPPPMTFSSGVVFPSVNEQSPPVVDVLSLPTSMPPQESSILQGASPSGGIQPPSFNTATPNSSLLSEFMNVRSRYDTLQRGFRDCHLALRELKKDLSSLGATSEAAIILQKAVERLDDFNEDARVEIEIRISDEARIASGYEALLTIPGAMSDEVDRVAVEAEMHAFVDGTGKAVKRATEGFNRKLDDLQHDIASVKRALHDLTAAAVESPVATSPAATPPSWTSWTTNLLSPSRSASASPGPAPTFGSVMTSPRLRQASFSSHPRKASDPDSPSPHHDPFAGLDLRIAMPAHVVPAYPAAPPRTTPRPRVSSTTYMLGLGARSSFGLNTMGGAKSPQSPLAEKKELGSAVSDGSEDDTGSDVE